MSNAIQNFNTLKARFSGYEAMGSTDVVNLNGESGVKKNGKFHDLNIFRRLGRTKAERDANLAARQALLSGLAKTFDLDMNSENFFAQLKAKLGCKNSVLKSGDFGLVKGQVTSTQPLTQRRVKAIMTAVSAAVNRQEQEAYDAAHPHETKFKKTYGGNFNQVKAESENAIREFDKTKSGIPFNVVVGPLADGGGQPLLFNGKAVEFRNPPNDGNCFFASVILAQGKKTGQDSQSIIRDILQLRHDLATTTFELLARCGDNTNEGKILSTTNENGVTQYTLYNSKIDFRVPLDDDEVRNRCSGATMKLTTAVDDPRFRAPMTENDPAFLAHHLKRPVIVYKRETTENHNNRLVPMRYDQNLETGERFENEEPIEIFYENGHFMAFAEPVDPKSLSVQE